MRQSIWDYVSHSPLHNLWDFQGTSVKVVMQRTFKSFMDDNLVSRAAELGYYFLFALFPTLLFASSIIGLAAKRADAFYIALLHYLAIVIPHSAFQMVIDTFNQTTQAASGGKIRFGLAAALWSASVGFAAIQDTANTVYKVKETRPYWRAKGEAMLVTLLLSVVISVTLAVLLGADYVVKRRTPYRRPDHYLRSQRGCAWWRSFAWVVVSGHADAGVRDDLLLRAGREEQPLALALAGRGHWDLRLVRGVYRPARLPSLLQQLLGDLRLAGRGHHPADVVLHHRPDAADWARRSTPRSQAAVAEKKLKESGVLPVRQRRPTRRIRSLRTAASGSVATSSSVAGCHPAERACRRRARGAGYFSPSW